MVAIVVNVEGEFICGGMLPSTFFIRKVTCHAAIAMLADGIFHNERTSELTFTIQLVLLMRLGKASCRIVCETAPRIAGGLLS